MGGKRCEITILPLESTLRCSRVLTTFAPLLTVTAAVSTALLRFRVAAAPLCFPSRPLPSASLLPLSDSITKFDLCGGRPAAIATRLNGSGCLNILMHHGGAFYKEGALTYDGGDVSFFRNIYKDLVPYFHVVELSKSVGFKDGDTLFYALPGRSLDNGGIDQLKDDASVSDMLKFANQTNFLEIYVQHNEHDDVGVYQTAADNTQHDNINENMVLVPAKKDMVVFCQQLRHHRINLLMAFHIAYLYWMFYFTKQQLRLIREPCRFDPTSRTKNLNDMIYETDIECVDQLWMDRRCFWNLCSMVRDIGGLRDTRNVEEMVAMFLHILAYGEKSRSMKKDYQRSQETISRHFNIVLGAALKLWRVLLKSPHPISENCKDERWKWFKNCLGALDGTYIKARVPAVAKPRYRSSKNEIATNVLVACAPDMQYTYVLAGWEGSADDARVLRDALARPNGLRVPCGKKSSMRTGSYIYIYSIVVK